MEGSNVQVEVEAEEEIDNKETTSLKTPTTTERYTGEDNTMYSVGVPFCVQALACITLAGLIVGISMNQLSITSEESEKGIFREAICRYNGLWLSTTRATSYDLVTTTVLSWKDQCDWCDDIEDATNNDDACSACTIYHAAIVWILFGICGICVQAVAIAFSFKFDPTRTDVAAMLFGILSFASLLALIQWSVWLARGCMLNGKKVWLPDDAKMDIGASTALVIASWCLSFVTVCVQAFQVVKGTQKRKSSGSE